MDRGDSEAGHLTKVRGRRLRVRLPEAVTTKLRHEGPVDPGCVINKLSNFPLLTLSFVICKMGMAMAIS